MNELPATQALTWSLFAVRDQEELADSPLVQLQIAHDHPALALDRLVRLCLLSREGREGPRR
eukprot:15443275-Alexandrium_andersonii.AAC.1